MNDLETLRPEVQEAVTWIDKNQIHPTHKVWGVVRAELLRLANDNAMLRGGRFSERDWRALKYRAEAAEADLAEAQNTIAAQQDTMGTLKRKLALVEAELTALKARIEAAPLTTFRRAMLGTPHAWVEETFACPEWIGKSVRLVVEE